MKTTHAVHLGKPVQENAFDLNHVARKTISVLGRFLAGIFALLLGLVVVLLPISTSVPAWVWIPLLLADVGLVILQFRLKPAWRGMAVGLLGMLLVGVIGVFTSQSFATTPPITGPDGKPLPGSIAVLEKVTLNGSEQWITIRGQDTTKPIFLNLGMGGPGGGGFIQRTLFEPLEKDFVVVSWDEPGTGKSYEAVPMTALTTERFIEDAHALTLYLRGRFHQEKIYVYGTSWTSILGIWLVQQYPDLYHAYIGNAQMINTTENDIMGYDLALEYSIERGDTNVVETLQQNGPPPYTGEGMLSKYIAFLDVLNDYMHAPRYSFIVPIAPFIAPEYGLMDKLNHTRGLMESFEVVYPQLKNLDFKSQAATLEVPVYIFMGRNDVNAMPSLVEEYINLLEAPQKQLIWLDGGHGLDGSNLGQFVDVMINTVLVQTKPAP